MLAAFLFFLGSSLVVLGDTTTTEEAAPTPQGATESEAEPEEEPPPPVGLALAHVPPEGGTTKEIAGGTSVHFRMIDNQVHVFRLDEDGLIMAPDLFSVSVMLVGAVGNESRQFLPTHRSGNGLSYTASRIIRLPHIFTVTLNLFSKDTNEPDIQVTFRYNSAEMPGDATQDILNQ